jgi:hypothetical protein
LEFLPVKSNPVFLGNHGGNIWVSTDNVGSFVSRPSYVYGVVNKDKDDDAESLSSSQLENRTVVTIFNPNTKEVLKLNRQEFYRYMTMTNGNVLEWVLEWEK